MTSIFWISWEVLKPSKKCKNGTEALIAERCATSARSITSCTDADAKRAKPVCLVAITSLWSPKIERAWVARALAETWKTAGNSSPAILYILGIISSSPWEAVKVVVSIPAEAEPCTAPAAPASDCISTICSLRSKMFFRPRAAHSSQYSAMVDEGVMG